MQTWVILIVKCKLAWTRTRNLMEYENLASSSEKIPRSFLMSIHKCPKVRMLDTALILSNARNVIVHVLIDWI